MIQTSIRRRWIGSECDDHIVYRCRTRRIRDCPAQCIRGTSDTSKARSGATHSSDGSASARHNCPGADARCRSIARQGRRRGAKILIRTCIRHGRCCLQCDQNIICLRSAGRIGGRPAQGISRTRYTRECGGGAARCGHRAACTGNDAPEASANGRCIPGKCRASAANHLVRSCIGDRRARREVNHDIIGRGRAR